MFRLRRLWSEGYWKSFDNYFFATLVLRLWGALIGLIIGGVLVRVLGDPIRKALQISNFADGRWGYFDLLVLLPLFGLTGAVLGAIMIGADWRFNLRVVGVLLVIAGGFVLTHKDTFFPPPPTVEHLGNFELLTYNREGWDEGWDVYYKLRYRGQPFPVNGQAGLAGNENATDEPLYSIITFTLPISFSAPVFVFNVKMTSAYGQDRSYFHLVREVDGRATTTLLCFSDTNSRDVSADWLDVEPSDPTAPRDITVHRKALAGGRWLLLGDECVLDVWTLTAYPFPSLPPLGDGSVAAIESSTLPIGLSPDQRSLVRVGTARGVGVVDTTRRPVRLIVYNFIKRTSYSLPVERLRMRYNSIQELDAVWLAHYFEWQQSPGASDQLAPRHTFTPLPYHVHLFVDGDSRQYQLLPVKPAMFDVLLKLLVQEFKAVPLDTIQRDATSQEINLQLNGQMITLFYKENWGSRVDGFTASRVGFWTGPRETSRLVETIANRVDDVLKTGQYDDLFLGDPVSN